MNHSWNLLSRRRRSMTWRSRISWGCRTTPSHPPFLFSLVKQHGEYVGPTGNSSASDAIAMGSHVGTHIDALCHFSCGGKLLRGRGGGRGAVVRGGPAEVLHRHGGADPAPGRAARYRGPARRRGAGAGFRNHAGDLDAAVAGAGGRDPRGRCGPAAHGMGGVLRAIPRSSSRRSTVPARRIARRAMAERSRDLMPPVRTRWRSRRCPTPRCRCTSICWWSPGIHIIECLNLEELAAARVYEFLFVALPLKIRGATASPIRPVALAPA